VHLNRIPFALSKITASLFHSSSSVKMPPTKRKAASSPSGASKKQKPIQNGSTIRSENGSNEENGYVLREFYPPEMTNARAKDYKDNNITRPIEEFNSAQKATVNERNQIKIRESVIFWFKCDLRLKDNQGLHVAAQKAKDGNVPLICMYLISPQDFQAHLTSAVRVDFILRTLAIMKEELKSLGIPLYVETVEKRKQLPARILDLCEDWGASHVYANIEYEVDELRREASLTKDCLDKGISFNAFSDTCVVDPGELASGTGNQYAVYSPWFRAWVAFLHKHPHRLDLFGAPEKVTANINAKIQKLFGHPIPSAPNNKSLSKEDQKKYASLWPAGEHEAQARLQKFLEERASAYADNRNIPGVNGTSCISVHHAAGTISARTSIAAARDKNSTAKLDAGNKGIMTWISEVAWRDFYKHVLVHWPYVWYVL
jgi:deoxyribodipyrimidine photo-lyase